MAKILIVRVSAQTWDEGEVEKRWPALCRLGFSPPVLFNAPKGVLELVEHLADRLDMGVLPEEEARLAGEAIRRAAQAKARLEAELAEWNAKAASALTDDIEEALDEAERAARGTKKGFSLRE